MSQRDRYAVLKPNGEWSAWAEPREVLNWWRQGLINPETLVCREGDEEPLPWSVWGPEIKAACAPPRAPVATGSGRRRHEGSGRGLGVFAGFAIAAFGGVLALLQVPIGLCAVFVVCGLLLVIACKLQHDGRLADVDEVGDDDHRDGAAVDWGTLFGLTLAARAVVPALTPHPKRNTHVP